MSDIISSVNPPSPSTPARQFNSGESKCNICQEEFDTGDEPEIPLTLSCGHVLGSICLSRWLHVPNRKNGCPLCRKTLFKARVEPEDGYEEGEIQEDDFEEEEMEDEDYRVDEDVGMMLEQEEAHWANIVNPQHNPRTAGSPPPIEDELSTEMHRIFGAGPSTSAVIEMLRSHTNTRNPRHVIESLIENHLLISSTPIRSGNSYRELKADLYRRLKAALTATTNWLSTRPAFNAYACSQLHQYLYLSLDHDAANFRTQDKNDLINLLKAGVFTSPRMDVSFSLRLIIAEGISTYFLPFGPEENPASAHMYRVLNAMPNLCGVYQEINVAEIRDRTSIAEYNFREAWEADMAPVMGARRSFNLMEQTSTPPPSVGSQEQAAAQDDMSAISESINRTLTRVENLLGIQPGSATSASEAGWRAEAELLEDIVEDVTREESTDSISRQIDRTLARAHELIRGMDGPEPQGHEAINSTADTEPRRGRGGSRGGG